MIFIKKAWIKIRQYWWVALTLGVGLFAVLFFQNGKGKSWDALKFLNKKVHNQMQNYDVLVKEIKLAEVHKSDTLENLEKDYKVKIDEIDKKKTKEIDKIIKESKEDPEALAKKIAEEMGWEYVE